MADRSYTRKIYHKQGGDEMVVASGGKITIEDGGALYMETGADIDIVSGGDIDVASGAGVNIQTGAELVIEGGGQLTVQSTGELEVESGGNIQIEGGGQISIENTAELEIESGGVLQIESGGKISAESGGEIELKSGAVMDLQSGFEFYIGSATYTAGIRDLLVSLFNYNRMISYAIASNSTAVGVLIPSVIYNYAKFHKIIAASNLAAGALWLASAPSVGMELIIQLDVSAASTTNLGQSTAVVVSCDAGVIMTPVTYVSNSRMTLINSSNSVAKVHLACLKAGEWAVVSISSATAVTFT